MSSGRRGVTKQIRIGRTVTAFWRRILAQFGRGWPACFHTSYVGGRGPLEPDGLRIGVAGGPVIAAPGGVFAARIVGITGPATWIPAVRARSFPRARAGLQDSDHPLEVGEWQPERAGAPVALPDAENRHPAVGVPTEPHGPGITAHIEEDLAFARQRNGIWLRHLPIVSLVQSGCLANAGIDGCHRA
jgi:hypothetical protein